MTGLGNIKRDSDSNKVPWLHLHEKGFTTHHQPIALCCIARRIAGWPGKCWKIALVLQQTPWQRSHLVGWTCLGTRYCSTRLRTIDPQKASSSATQRLQPRPGAAGNKVPGRPTSTWFFGNAPWKGFLKIKKHLRCTPGTRKRQVRRWTMHWCPAPPPPAEPQMTGRSTNGYS